MLRFIRISPPVSVMLCAAWACGIVALHSGILLALELCITCTGIAWIALRRYTKLTINKQTFALCAITMLLGALRYHNIRSSWQLAHSACMNHNHPLIIQIIDIAPGKGSYPHVITGRITHHAENPDGARGWNILMYTMQAPACCVSDICRLNVLRCSPIDSSTEYGLYLEKEGIVSVSFLQRCALQNIERPSFSLRRSCWRTRNRIVRSLKEKMSPHVHALATSLVVGNGLLDRSMLSEMRSSFNQWGIVHQLARSGLHIVILIGLWQKCIGFLVHNIFLQQLIMFLLMIGYAALSCATISFVRAIASYILATVALLGAQQQDALHSVFFIALFALLTQPLYLFALDFQLSFLLTAALAWSARIARAERRYH